MTEYHLLYGFIQHPGSVTSKHLKKERKSITGVLEQLPTLGQISIEEIKPSSRIKEWITLASADAVQRGKESVSEGNFLRHYKKFFPQLSFEISEDEEDETPDFLLNLNQLADQGKLAPVIGRSAEIRRVQEILCRRTKNNPVLVGPPGVGKSAIVEGLPG